MRYHLLSLAELPKMAGTYCFGMDQEEMEWTQEGTWLLLFSLHDGLLTISGKAIPFRRGAVSVIPPASRCRLTSVGKETAVSFWFRFSPGAENPPIVAIPAFIQLEESTAFWEQTFRVALNRMFQMGPELRVAFGHLLWAIGQDPSAIRQSPALEAAEKYIEDHIAETMRIERLADEVGVSHNQLIRIFRDEHGVTPLEYLRSRRQYHACRLLLEGKLSIKQVAVEVGVPDLAQFNRLVQRAAGVSPRQLRDSHRPPNLFRAKDESQ